MTIYDARCTQCSFTGEISKPRDAALPACPRCGGTLKRIYRAPAVHYAAVGFSATDGRLAKIIGPARAARFEAQKKEVEGRAQQGRLTPYEKSLEAVRHE